MTPNARTAMPVPPPRPLLLATPIRPPAPSVEDSR